MDIPLKGHTIGARIGRNIRQGDHQLLPLSAMRDMALPAVPCNAMQQRRTAECQCGLLVAHNDHPASPQHRRANTRPT
jgi:hypothetical protein